MSTRKKKKLGRILDRLSVAPDRIRKGDSWRASPGISKDGAANATARGYGAEWRKERAAFLLEHPFCAFCLKRGLYVAASVVDHIKPHNGDAVLFWNKANWQALCSTCHSSTKQRMEHAQRYGRENARVCIRAPEHDRTRIVEGVGGSKVQTDVDT